MTKKNFVATKNVCCDRNALLQQRKTLLRQKNFVATKKNFVATKKNFVATKKNFFVTKFVFGLSFALSRQSLSYIFVATYSGFVRTKFLALLLALS